MPKKVTFNAAAIAEVIHQAKSYGFSVAETAPFDWTTFKRKRDAYIQRLNGIYERNLNNDKVEYVHGWAKLLSPHSVEVTLDDGSKSVVNAKKILLAMGGRPTIPPQIPGSELGTNSNGFFDIETLPKKVALVGAGYIAVEFAGMFNALGVETHLFIRHDTFLRHFDPMIQETVTKEYERLGVHVHKRSEVAKVEKNESTGKLTVHYGNPNAPGSISEVDHLIWAVGRTPQTDNVGIETTGVKLNEKGHVIVDRFQNTNVENIYALGDITGRVELTPVAIAAGRKLSARLFGGEQFRTMFLDYENIPSVVFSHPEVGAIGLTEPQAVEKYGRENLRIYKTNFTAMYYAMMDPEQKGLTAY